MCYLSRLLKVDSTAGNARTSAGRRGSPIAREITAQPVRIMKHRLSVRLLLACCCTNSVNLTLLKRLALTRGLWFSTTVTRQTARHRTVAHYCLCAGRNRIHTCQNYPAGTSIVSENAHFWCKALSASVLSMPECEFGSQKPPVDFYDSLISIGSSLGSRK